MLNNSAADVEKVLLSGTGWMPEVSSGQGAAAKGKRKVAVAEEGSELFFKPTFVSQSSTMRYLMRNKARIPCVFEWQIPEYIKDIVSVEPQCGSLRGNEELEFSWTFRPQAQRTYQINPVLRFSAIGSVLQEVREQEVTLVGEGCAGVAEFHHCSYTIPTTLVDQKVATEIVLMNNSDCAVSYSLGVEFDVSLIGFSI